MFAICMHDSNIVDNQERASKLQKLQMGRFQQHFSLRSDSRVCNFLGSMPPDPPASSDAHPLSRWLYQLALCLIINMMQSSDPTYMSKVVPRYTQYQLYAYLHDQNPKRHIEVDLLHSVQDVKIAIMHVQFSNLIRGACFTVAHETESTTSCDFMKNNCYYRNKGEVHGDYSKLRTYTVKCYIY